MMKLLDIYRFPVKGLSPENMQEVDLHVGQGLPLDRRFGLIHASSIIDPVEPKWAEKKNFFMLARDAKLAQLTSEYDAETGFLTLFRKGKQVSRGQLGDPMGHLILSTFFTGFLGDSPRTMPKIVELQGEGGFWDVNEPFISIINKASVDDLERVTRVPVSPARFRGNLLIDALEAWVESSWIGKTIRIGSVELDIIEPIGRCSATHVNPDTGEEDINMVLTLKRGFGHTKCGVYAKVSKPGTIRLNDEITLLS